MNNVTITKVTVEFSDGSSSKFTGSAIDLSTLLKVQSPNSQIVSTVATDIATGTSPDSTTGGTSDVQAGESTGA